MSPVFKSTLNIENVNDNEGNQLISELGNPWRSLHSDSLDWLSQLCTESLAVCPHLTGNYQDIESVTIRTRE